MVYLLCTLLDGVEEIHCEPGAVCGKIFQETQGFNLRVEATLKARILATCDRGNCHSSELDGLGYAWGL